MTTNKFIIDALREDKEATVSIVNISAWGEIGKTKYIKLAKWTPINSVTGAYSVFFELTDKREDALKAIDILPTEEVKEYALFFKSEGYHTDNMRNIGILKASDNEFTILNKY